MRNTFSKLVLAATFGLALAFTFSCSKDEPICDDVVCCEGNGCPTTGGSSSSGGGGGSSSSEIGVSSSSSNGSSGSGANSGGGGLVTEVYTLESKTTNQFTFTVVDMEDQCKEGGILETETYEESNTINYSIDHNTMTFKISEYSDTLLFKGTSNELLGTWTRTKNKTASCQLRTETYCTMEVCDEEGCVCTRYENESRYSCKAGYDITQAVFTPTTVAITRDECGTDTEVDGSIGEAGYTIKIIDCNTIELSKGSNKITIRESRNSAEVSYNGQSCKVEERNFTKIQKQAACTTAWNEHQNEPYWEDYYYDILLGNDFEDCLKRILPAEFWHDDDEDNLGKVAAKSVAKAKSKNKLTSLLKRRN